MDNDKKCDVRFFTVNLSNDKSFSAAEGSKVVEKLTQAPETLYRIISGDEKNAAVNILERLVVVDCAIGPQCVAFLMRSGHVCRLKVATNFIDAKKVTSHTDDPPPDPKSSQLGPLRIQRSLTSARTSNRTAASQSSGPLSSGIRLIRTSSTGIRTSSSSSRSMPIINSRSSSMMVSQSQVPENLISQVQNILQGKGRTVIMRELQRSNLDVNTAVNNLLSRDDDDADEVDDAGSDYIQCDDLMSWLDGGLVAGEHPRVVIDPDSSIPENLIYSGFSFSGSERERSRLIEQIRSRRSKASGRSSSGSMGGSSSRNSAAAAVATASGGSSSAAAAFDQRGGGAGAELESVLVDVSSHSPTWAEETSKKSSSSTPAAKSGKSSGSSATVDEQTVVSYGDELEWWDDSDGEHIQFKAIASMHSELVAVDNHGNLCQWLWSNKEPYENDGVYHPRAVALGLTDQVITFLAAGEIRASVVCKSGAIASWTDDGVSHYSTALDITCTMFDVLKNERIISLQACSLYSAILTDTNRIYWWGVFPFNQRKKLIEKSQKSLLENVDKDNGGSMEITEGMQVCMKNFPIYHAGAVAVNLSDGIPKCGRLLEPVWSLEKKGSFKILKSATAVRQSTAVSPARSSQPHQSGASTRSSSSSFNIDSLLDANRSSTRSGDEEKEEEDDDDEEVITIDDDGADDDIDEIDEVEHWPVNNLIFIKDIKSAPVGRVMKVDKNLVAVQFTDSYDQRTSSDAESIFKQCRLMDRNDVVPVKSTAFHRVLDCIQKAPKRLIVDQNAKLHTIDANDQGVVAIASRGEQDSVVGGLRKYNLGTGRCNSATNFSTSIQSFLASDAELATIASPSSEASSNDMDFFQAIVRHQQPVAGPRFIGNGKICPNLAVDRNGMVYPLQADENLGIRDPIWFDVPPLLACNMGVHRDPLTKKRCLLMALVFKRQQIMPDIWRRDLPAINTLLAQVEKEDSLYAKHYCLMMSREKCDGNRNILHMCVSVSTTSSNKESKEDEESRHRKQLVAASRKGGRRSGDDDSKGGDGDGGDNKPAAGGEMMSNIRSAISDLERRITLPATAIVSSRSSTPAASSSSGVEAAAASRSRYSSSQVDSPMNLMSLFSNSNTFDDYFGESDHRWGSRMTSSSNKDGGDDGPSGSGRKGSSRKQKKEVSFSLPASENTTDNSERGTRNDAIEVLRRLCDSEAFRKHLPDLLCEKDAYGHTPFMYAISSRAYPAAQVLLSTIIKMLNKGEISMTTSSKNTRSLHEMIYPDHDKEDNNPLHMLCSNDVCSFTWTGAQHINQDIFECRTCGLTDSLCCCTECARVCHKGHDCTLKRTSPTAYCDCWEKCPCKSLVSGDQPVRLSLLHSLVEHTDLYRLPNGDGEHILRFMVKTLARQKREHSQYRPQNNSRSSRLSATSSGSRTRVSRLTTKSPPPDYFTDMPEHDLRPPKFCHKALLELLGNADVVASLIDHDEVQIALDSPSSSSVLPEDKVLLRQQQGISHLDQFTNVLITQCQGNDHLDQLLNTLVDMTRGDKTSEGVSYCQRFIRSVIRVYIVLQAQTYPEKIVQRSYVAFNESRRQKCRRAFMALITTSIRELCEVAESLIAPVRMGVTRPCQDFIPYHLQMHDVQNTCGRVFNRDPFTPSWLHPGGNDDNDGDDEDHPHFSGGGGGAPPSRRSRPNRKHKRSGGDTDDDTGAASGANTSSTDIKQGSTLTESLVQEILQEVGGESAAYDYEMRSDDMEMTCIEETDSNSDHSSEFLDLDQAHPKEGLKKKSPSAGGSSKQAVARRGGGFDPDDDDDDEDDDDDDDEDDDEDGGDMESDDEDQEDHRRHNRGGAGSDSDEYGWQENNNLERAATRKQRLRARQVPHSLEWAMGRSGELTERFSTARTNITNSGNNSTNSRTQGSSGSLGLDRIRRTTDHHIESPYINSLLERHHQDGYKNSKMEEIMQSTSSSSSTTNDRLARLFGVCVRDISHLINTLNKDKYPEESEIKNLLQINKQDCHELLAFTQLLLRPTWEWLMRIVDSTEAQLRYGQALSLHTLTNHPDHPNYKGDKGGSRITKKATDKTNRDELFAVDGLIKQDFLSYTLSLMRSHSDEHSATLPVMDVSALRHVAYVLDAYLSILRGFTFPNTKKSGTISKKFSDHHRHADISGVGGSEEEDDDDDEDGLFPAYGDFPSSFDVENSSASTRKPPAPSSGKTTTTTTTTPAVVSDEDVMDNLAQPLNTFFQRSNSMSFVAATDSNPFEVRCEVALPLAMKPHLLQLNARKEELFGRPRIIENKNHHLPKLGLSRRHDCDDDDDERRKSREGSLGSNSSSATSEQDNEQPTKTAVVKKEQVEAAAGDLKSANSRKKSSRKEAAAADEQLVSSKLVAARKRSSRRRPLDQPESASSKGGGAPSRKRAKKGGQLKESKSSESCSNKSAKKSQTVAGAPEEEKVGGFLDTQQGTSVDSILSRCRLVLELFCRVFLETVGAEPKSILYELGGFEVREAKFRKEMESTRTGQSDDLLLTVNREREQMIPQTFRQINHHCRRKIATGLRQPLQVLRVKVTFSNEPGEGTGVARSFYTAIAEALRSSEPLPPLEPLAPPTSTTTSSSRRSALPLDGARGGGNSSDRGGNEDNDPFPPFLLHRMFRRERRGSSTSGPLSVSSAPYYARGRRERGSGGGQFDRNKIAIGERLYPKIEATQALASLPDLVPKVTGMILRLPAYELLLLMRSDRNLQERVAEAIQMLRASEYSNETGEGFDEDATVDPPASSEAPATAPTTTTAVTEPSTAARNKQAADDGGDDDVLTAGEETDEAMETDQDNGGGGGGKPLFFESAKGKGFLVPAMNGDTNELRMNAYRNVGRLMGLCLLQNELFPLPLCRHVIKVILGRKVNWHDLAFYDSVIYDSMRQTVKIYEDGGDMELSFVMDLKEEEGGGHVELIKNGENVSVDAGNVRDYVRRYSLYRMLVCCRPALEMIRAGVLDVVNRSHLDGLTPEDFRLLINGCGQVDVQTLISYTLFSDEIGKSASATPEKLTEFKRWFWWVVHHLDNNQRQELLFFWTGSPALPASEDGFQPLPSITIRPPSDLHLPTANTCISKLYVPLYSSRHILQQKLLVAIKTKSFGFV